MWQYNACIYSLCPWLAWKDSTVLTQFGAGLVTTSSSIDRCHLGMACSGGEGGGGSSAYTIQRWSLSQTFYWPVMMILSIGFHSCLHFHHGNTYFRRTAVWPVGVCNTQIMCIHSHTHLSSDLLIRHNADVLWRWSRSPSLWILFAWCYTTLLCTKRGITGHFVLNKKDHEKKKKSCTCTIAHPHSLSALYNSFKLRVSYALQALCSIAVAPSVTNIITLSTQSLISVMHLFLSG